MKIKPYGNLVLIKIMPDEDVKTQAGIIMPDTVATPAPLRCEIVSLGSQSPKDLHSGDMVLIPKDAAAMPLEEVLPTAEDGGLYKLVFPNAIIAILTE
jgi:co-chaperonin GroES (HSP10)